MFQGTRELRSSGLDGGGGLRSYWKTKGKDGATFRLILTVYVALVILYDTVGHAEPESGSFADGFRGIERIQCPVQITETWPSVFHFDHCP